MRTLFYNGKIHTLQGQELVSALLVEDGIITCSGNDADILNLKDNNCEVIDLQGQVVVPGFNDSHLHLLGYGLAKRNVDLLLCKSLEEIKQRVLTYRQEQRNCQIIYGRGWNQDCFDKPLIPQKSDLDAICSDIPLVLTRVCGHIAVVNSAALAHFGFNENFKAPPGGDFDYEKGLLTEKTLELITNKSFSVEEIEEIIQAAVKDLWVCGITSLQSDDFGCGEYGRVIQAYQNLATKNALGIRVYQQCLFSELEKVQRFLRETKDFVGSPWYSLGPIKLLSDGSLGARTAFLRTDYSDDPGNRGTSCFSKDDLAAIVETCNAAGVAVAIHCIGDGAIERALDSIERARQITGFSLRNGIVHCQITDPALLKRMGDLRVMAYVQPIFLDYDLHIVQDRVGADLAASSYAFKTLQNLGANVALGTDCPVEPFNTMNNIYCALSRQDLKGYPAAGYNPQEALSIQEALMAYTVNSAYCSYEENIKGKLCPGYYGDMAVLDQDIFNIDYVKIKETQVVKTIVAGKVVYQK